MSDADETPTGETRLDSLAGQPKPRAKSSARVHDDSAVTQPRLGEDPDEVTIVRSDFPPPSPRFAPAHEPEWEADEEASRPSMAEADELVGQLVDARYRIESVLGIGSMGIVYVARHLAVGKRVALKVLRQQFMQDTEVTQRFAAEATAATAIGNAHIVDTLDFGKLSNGSAYQVMEFLEGQMLSQALRRQQRMPLTRILSIARQVAVALGAAHDAGIVHRDLKPDNVFLLDRENGEDFVKILDFGIAKFGVGQNNLTHAGAVFGTPNYMAPEQGLGKPTSPATDVYALGVILYEMASGAVPFSGDSPIAVLTRHASEAPQALGKRVKDLPRRFQKLVHRCLEKEPAARFASMGDLILELDAVSAGVPLPASSPPTSEELEDRVAIEALRPRGTRWGALSVLVLFGLVGAGYVGYSAHGVSPVVSVIARPMPSRPSSAIDEDDAQTAAHMHEVALVLFPLDAHVVVGDHDLGAMPVSVKVPEGQTVSTEVRRDGYWTRKLRLDGTKTRIVVGLVKREAGAGQAPSPQSDDPH